MLQNIAEGIHQNHPSVKLMVLLIDERPEEVTDMKRNVQGGEVIASSLDMDVESHVRLSQLVIDRAKRLAESGQDVFLMLDSILLGLLVPLMKVGWQIGSRWCHHDWRFGYQGDGHPKEVVRHRSGIC